jgi:SWI/SNF-related matrix-associated actin-dependent regulator of chromatin subfamily A3
MCLLWTLRDDLHFKLEELRKMREKDPSAKALVFSQFQKSIDWMKTKLAQENFT